jgi:hypothetical protein
MHLKTGQPEACLTRRDCRPPLLELIIGEVKSRRQFGDGIGDGKKLMRMLI